MKRYSAEHAKQVAQDFIGSQWADSWTLFGSSVRRALLDSLVMNAIRIADNVDSETTLIAAELVNFRNAIEDALAAGVKRHRGLKSAFKVEE